jgi:heat shock protein HslJ
MGLRMRAQAAALAFFAAVAGPVAGWAGDAGAAPPGAKLMGGMFVYLADAARLTDCFTDRSYPVAMEGDYLSLERAYTEARPGPGEPLMVTFAGSIEQRPPMEGPGPVPTALVARFVHVWPGETCERNRATASLTNTYWRIVKLDDAVIGVSEGEREPHLVLRPDEPAFSATAGCNQMVGGYKLEGDRLRFEGVASTMMACPPPLDADERRLGEVLAASASWNIHGQVLELFDKDGKPVALFHSVYLR